MWASCTWEFWLGLLMMASWGCGAWLVGARKPEPFVYSIVLGLIALIALIVGVHIHVGW